MVSDKASGLGEFKTARNNGKKMPTEENENESEYHSFDEDFMDDDHIKKDMEL